MASLFEAYILSLIHIYKVCNEYPNINCDFVILERNIYKNKRRHYKQGQKGIKYH